MNDDPRPAPTRATWWARVTWQAEVASGMTLLGFDDWQAQQRRQDWLDDAANFADADEVVVRLASDAMTTDLKLTGAQVATMFRALAASEVNGDDDALAMIVSTLKGWNSGNGTGANLRKHYAEALDDMEAMIAALRNQDDDTLKRTNPQEQ